MKRNMKLYLSLLMISAASCCTADQLSDRMIGWWKMDEAPGATVLADSSGHGRDATLGSGVTMVSGKFGNAALFDGTGAGWARFTANLWLTNFTMSAWVKMSSFNNSYPKIFQLSNAYYQFNQSQPGKLSLGMGTDPRADWISNGTSPFIVDTGKWVHTAVVLKRTYTNETGWVAYPTFYVNGLRCGDPGVSKYYSPERIGASVAYIGNNTSNGSGIRGIDGALDDVRLYCEALSDREILDLYQNSPVSVDAGTDQTCCRPYTVLQGALTSSNPYDASIAATSTWSVVSAPSGDLPVFEHPWIPCTKVTLPQDGIYTFRLTAFSELGIVSNDVTVTRNDSAASGNSAPVVTPDEISVSSVLGSGAAIAAVITDDGNPGTAQIRWSKVSGPGGVFFDDAFAAETTAWFTTNGIYVLRMTADDGDKTGAADVTVTVSLPSGDLTAGLIHWWQMDESPDLSKSYDTIGENTLSLINKTLLQPAKTGNGLRFPAYDSYALANTIFTNAECFTFSLWLYYDAAYTNNIGKRIFDYGNSRFYMYFAPDHVYLATRNLADTGDYSWRQQSYSLENDLNRWVHLTVLYDRRPSATAGKQQGFYINGVSTGSSALSGTCDGSKAFTTGAFYIGGNPWGRNFDGVFDDMRVYDRLLSEEEIRLLAVDPDKNHAPAVEAPEEITVSTGETINSPATVYDDGQPPNGTLVTEWSVISGDAEDILFSDDESAESTITISRSGEYTLRLSATDGERYSAVNIKLHAVPSGTLLLVQ